MSEFQNVRDAEMLEGSESYHVILDNISELLQEYYAKLDSEPIPEDSVPTGFEGQLRELEKLTEFLENNDLRFALYINHIDEDNPGEYGKDTTVILRFTDKKARR